MKKYKLYIMPDILDEIEIVRIFAPPTHYELQEQADTMTVLLGDGVWAQSNDILRENGILNKDIDNLVDRNKMIQKVRGTA